MAGIAGGVATFIALFSIIEGSFEKSRTWLRESGGLEKVTVQGRSISRRSA